MLGSKEQRTEGMKRQAQELIDQAYERGFKAGKEQEQDIPFYDEAVEKAYQRGLDDAWEAASKIVNAYTHANVENPNGLHKMFGDYLTAHTFDMYPAEAIEKIRQYEEQKKAENKAVNVGDEVFFVGGNGVVIDEISDDEVYVFNDLGCVEKMEKRLIVKTKRTFPQIAEILYQLQEGE